MRAASADTPPGGAGYWPRCSADPDHRYCVESYEKNTGSGWVAVPDPDWGTPGVYDEPYVDTLDNGTMRFGLYRTTVSSSGPTSDADVDPNTQWRYVVNTGSIRPRELYGVARDTDFSVSGSDTAGFQLTLTVQPSPVHWRWDSSGPLTCEPGHCGDDTTVAGLNYDGFVTGYVTDLASSGLGASEIADRTGMIRSWNAQYASDPFYNFDTSALEIQLANPHLRATASGRTPATGYYEVFLPNAYLINVMQVPDPSLLSGGTLTVSRVGSTSTVPFTVTHEAGGIRVVIHGITFSSPKFRIHPKPTAPGKPRWGSVSRIAPTKVRLSFRAPLADGGPNITSYQARCRRGTGAWHFARGTRSPLVIGSLPRARVTCQVRAANRVGWGKWNLPKVG